MKLQWLQALVAAAVGLPAMPTSHVLADEANARLPEPLQHVSTDLGPFADFFEVADVSLFKAGEFKTPDPRPRVVQEDTVVWTLSAKRDLSTEELRQLLDFKGLSKADAAQVFERNRRSFYLRTRFLKTDNGTAISADAREEGYGLIPYWNRKSLKRGKKLKVWTHLGAKGAASIVATQATQAAFRSPPVPADE